MDNYFSQYCALLGSQESLANCQQAESLGDLLTCIKQLWGCEHLDDGELLGEINCLNQIPVDDSVKLAGTWLPYRYQPRRKQVSWLVPVGHATEPFQDEYISRCSQLLFNQIFQPRTSLESARQQAVEIADVQPAGFIFHLSRCGSTLISGCLSELDSTCVFSESPLLTELLLDNQLTTDEQKKTLRIFINLQAAAFPARPQMIIKWNAWDIFQWELIRSLYPQVPVIFLVRDPVEILASHHKMAGRHMSGDVTLAALQPGLAGLSGDDGILGFRVRVLHSLLDVVNSCRHGQGVLVKDYRQLTIAGMHGICRYFNLPLEREAIASVAQRMQYHSKALGHEFSSDSAQKHDVFDANEKVIIENRLLPLYQQIVLSAL